MSLDVRLAENLLENTIRDTIVGALGVRLPSVVSVGALRGVVTAGASSSFRNNDEFIPIIPAPPGPVTATYRWSRESTAIDDGVNVIKPTDAGVTGRWLLWTSPLRFVPVVGGNSFYLHELASGVLRRVILLDKDMTEEEVNALLLGSVPAVTIQANGDDTVEDTTDVTGHRWNTTYDFTVSVIAENLRDRREAAQGSTVDGDLGANALDGFLQALLAGNESAIVQAITDGVRNVRPGSCRNYDSELGQRRVVRSRTYYVIATTENPPAPNDYSRVTLLTVQANMSTLDGNNDPFDPNNVLLTGMGVTAAFGLTQNVAAGTAKVAGATVNYAGQSFTFPTYSDTYRDLNPNGTMTFISVPANGRAPAITAGALRIGVTTTNSTSVAFDRFFAATTAAYQNPIQIPL